MCMKCNNIEVLNAKCRNVSFFQPRDDLRSYVNCGKSNNLINESITKWRVFEPTLHWGSQTIEIKWLKYGSQAKRYFEYVDYLWKGINAKVLSGNISEVVLSVTIKDENKVAICACIAELMI